MSELKKLTKKQESVLVILLEGTLIQDLYSGSVSLEDADKNTYFIRRDTVRILHRGGYIRPAYSTPDIESAMYFLTSKGESYLEKYCSEEIKDFVEP